MTDSTNDIPPHRLRIKLGKPGDRTIRLQGVAPLSLQQLTEETVARYAREAALHKAWIYAGDGARISPGGDVEVWNPDKQQFCRDDTLSLKQPPE